MLDDHVCLFFELSELSIASSCCSPHTMNYDNRLEEKSVSWVAAFSVFVEMAVGRVETAVLLFPPESVANIDQH